ncbi:hypothetical protein ABER61_25760 [Brevibacillus formosus]|uniref:DUF4309 domain-containing protein n=1 Tax=Brevibacillus formosus TaxID=54913 RepID=A0A837KLT5_9BACL|nr:hypothetical protein [Brevibacillus formosus]KLH98133.1 hypothetical protein AA984_14020 [Brevibacillus formosus]MED1956994.1 hypothetical protein [Brevibacillus formosus]PSJ96435.1 hypothetical protein C7R91_11825 [Brevibacillus formosus]GED59302.1 hypothetical protein BFO01nite_34340 [Brevibacillus formosus]
MKIQPFQAIGSLLLAAVIGLTGVATVSSGHAPTTQPSDASKQESLPALVEASFQKLLEVEPSLKTWKIMGMRKSPISISGDIRGVWTFTLHETGNATDRGKRFAEVQFDSTTGILLHYHGGPFPAAKVTSRQKDYYLKRGQELMSQLLGSENTKQFKTVSNQSIDTGDTNGFTRELSDITFKAEKEQITLSIDSDGRLEQYHRVRLPTQKK